MSEGPEKQFLFRYTSFASAIDILRTSELTLLSPWKWPDRNDTAYLEAYLSKQKMSSLCVPCFTKASETAHHWSTFAPGPDGVRLMFDRDKLEQDFEKAENVILRDVKYDFVKNAKDNVPEASDWPFFKRYPYRGEEEVRAIVGRATKGQSSHRVKFSKSALKEFVLSPSLPKELQGNIKDLVRHVAEGRRLKVYRSTLYGNNAWINPVANSAGLQN